MKNFVNIIQVLLVLLLGLAIRVEAQVVNLNCNFMFIRGFYTCEVRAVNVPDDENVTFVIGGQHQPGWNNAMVQRVQVVAFILPFMVEQLAIAFPNLEEYSITSSILNRVQPRAFANNNVLRVLEIWLNMQLTTITELAFAGISSLVELDLSGNEVEMIRKSF